MSDTCGVGDFFGQQGKAQPMSHFSHTAIMGRMEHESPTGSHERMTEAKKDRPLKLADLHDRGNKPLDVPSKPTHVKSLADGIGEFFGQQGKGTDTADVVRAREQHASQETKQKREKFGQAEPTAAARDRANLGLQQKAGKSLADVGIGDFFAREGKAASCSGAVEKVGGEEKAIEVPKHNRTEPTNLHEQAIPERSRTFDIHTGVDRRHGSEAIPEREGTGNTATRAAQKQRQASGEGDTAMLARMRTVRAEHGKSLDTNGVGDFFAHEGKANAMLRGPASGTHQPEANALREKLAKPKEASRKTESKNETAMNARIHSEHDALKSLTGFAGKSVEIGDFFGQQGKAASGTRENPPGQTEILARGRANAGESSRTGRENRSSRAGLGVHETMAPHSPRATQLAKSLADIGTTGSILGK